MEVYVVFLLFVASTIIALVLWRELSERQKQIDALSLSALQINSELSEKQQAIVRLGLELFESESERDTLSRHLAERTMEMEDAREILQQQSVTIDMMEKVDIEEKKRLKLLEDLARESGDIIKSFVEVRKNGNGRAKDGTVVTKMSRCFTVEELQRLCLFHLGEKAANIVSPRASLVDQCTDVYLWCERNGKIETLMAALRIERPHLDW